LSCLLAYFTCAAWWSCSYIWNFAYLYEELLVEVLLATYVHVIECFATNTFLVNHCDFCHLRTSKFLFFCLRTSKTINLEEFVSHYSWLSFVLNICTKIALYLQFMVLFVGIVYSFMFCVILYSRYSYFVN